MKDCPFTAYTSPEFPRNFDRTPGTCSFLNPGCLSDLHRKCRDIAPVWLEGAHFAYKHHYSQNSILMFNWVLSHTIPSGVRFGGLFSPMWNDNILETPKVRLDLNPSTMTINAALQYQPFSWLRLEAMQQLEPALPAIADNVIRCDLIGKSYTGTIHAFNLQRDTGRMVVSYLQSLTSRLALGAEFCMEWRGEIKAANTALALKYAMEKMVFSATVSPQAFDISFWRQLHDNIQLGTSVVYNDRLRSAVGSIFYQWMFNDTTVRGMVDSEWSVGFTYNRRIQDLCCNMGISLLLCVPANKFACGFRFEIEANNDNVF